jgi:WD40 repeat protein
MTTMSLPVSGTQGTLAIRPCRTFEGHTKGTIGVIHIPGGQRLLTSSWDGYLRVWNLQCGKQTADNWQDGESINTIALSPEGKKVVGGSFDGDVTLWNFCYCQMDGAHMECHYLCAGIEAVGDWDVESGKHVETVLEIETGFGFVEAVMYSPDATMIATGGGSELKEFGVHMWQTSIELTSIFK